MKTKKGFLLRKLGKEYMIVAIGAASQEFNGMIRINETGAFYWNELKNGITIDELVAKTLERYEDIDEENARTDIINFISIIKDSLEIEKE